MAKETYRIIGNKTPLELRDAFYSEDEGKSILKGALHPAKEVDGNLREGYLPLRNDVEKKLKRELI